MQRVNVAAAALNQTPLDWLGNRDRIIEAIRAARAQGVRMLCLPELCISGYGCEDAFASSGVWRQSLTALWEIMPETHGMLVSVGLPLFHEGALYNTAAVLVDTHLVGFAAKQNLAGDGLHYEPRWFKRWPRGVVATTHIDGAAYPVGDILFNVGSVKLGFEICEDAWVADRPGAQLAAHGVDIVFNPSASHFAFGKAATRQSFVTNGGRAIGAVYVYSNLLGNEAGRAIYDGHTFIAAGERLVARGPRLTFDPWVVTAASVDLDVLRSTRARSAAYVPGVRPAENEIAVDWNPIGGDSIDTTIAPAPWEMHDQLKEEEFTRAISLGLYDYMRKSHTSGFVVSLSGGADSAAVCCLIYAMARFAGLSDEAIGKLLTTVYQSTRNSSTATRHAARTLASAIGARHIELDVDDLVTGYTHMIEHAVGRPLTWETDDITLQNIQARVRAPGAWLLANIENKLLLATSNRSEAAVGYATMDGDTAGGLSPIAGIDKAFLRHWLQWMQKTGPIDIGPIDAIDCINRQAPTAELRPLDEGQTDETDLMPYPVLDAIEEAAIGRKLAPLDTLNELRAAYPQYSNDQHAAWVKHFFKLWARNQWKRERYAPALHVDDRNLDPRTWCRFPILSGAFERELAELRDQTARTTT